MKLFNNIMNKKLIFPSVISFIFLLMLSGADNCFADIVDDFSGGNWIQAPDTPGKFSVEKGRLSLQDSPGKPGWITASKTIKVDVDKTPYLIVKVASLSDRGQVKLIREKPYDKQEAVKIDAPGLYAVNLLERFTWKGTNNIKVSLYSIGNESSIAYSYIKFAAALTPEEQSLIKKRESVGNFTLPKLQFYTVPLFNTCGIYYKTHEIKNLQMKYREKGGHWLKAFPPVYFKEDEMYRGSIVNLRENTEYELQITDQNGKILKSGTFKTWSSIVPIGKTIELNSKNFKKHLKITESGKPDAWIKYIAAKDFILQNNRKSSLIDLYQAKYVILEGLTLRGGQQNAISVQKCENIRIINCDISGWGRDGTQRFDKDGKFYTEKGKAINWDAGILIRRSKGTVVERCYIHDPAGRANSWAFSHPAGPEAIGIDKPASTVLCYNDFIGSDLHRWNDGVEGAGNFYVDGGFNRDADIYGNMICFANDDCIEIDGGQTNVRVFLNKFEGSLCGVSIQGCMSSPSYVFNNLLVNMGDEFDRAGQTIKTSSHKNGQSAVSFIFNNTCYGPSNDLNLVGNLKVVAKNNIFSGNRAIINHKRSPLSECDYNLLSEGDKTFEPNSIIAKPIFKSAKFADFTPAANSPACGKGIPVTNFILPDSNGKVDIGAVQSKGLPVLPFRPIPLFLDKYQLNFSPDEVKIGKTQTLNAEVKGENWSRKFRILKNLAFDWLKVTPSEGILNSGDQISFKVTVLPEKMTRQRIFKGGFLVKLDNGFSRPVTIYADTGISLPVKPPSETDKTVYIEVETTSGGNKYQIVKDVEASAGQAIFLAGEKGKKPVEYTFNIPKDGKYFVLFRVKSGQPIGAHDSLFFAIDDQKLKASHLLSKPQWTWALGAHNKGWSNTLQQFKLKAGKHTLKLAPRESIYIDMIAITNSDNLEAFLR